MIAEEIFGGRNSEWFDNLQGNHNDNNAYAFFPAKIGLPDKIPEVIRRDVEDFGFYGDHYIAANEFRTWFDKYRPDVDAGWVTTYDKWLMDTKGIIPDDPIKYLIYTDHKIEDLHFVEIENKYDCSKWLYNYLIEHSYDTKKYIIVYYFDC